MVRCRRASFALAVVIVTGGWSTFALGASLSNQLVKNIGRTATGTTSTAGVSSLDVFVPQLTSLAARGVDFPVASTTPGFTYRYNPDLGMFERSPSLGPALLERADTVGRGRFTIGGSYLYGNLDQSDGHSISGNTTHIALYEPSTGTFTGGTNKFKDWSLSENVFGFSATYGVTDRWDANLFVPVVWTLLDASSNVVTDANSGLASTDANKVGVGDILLRTKYRLTSGGPADLAAGLVFRMPSGSSDNFQGIGDFTIEPLFIASRTIGIASFHFNGGLEANADDVDRSRARYGLGSAIQVLDQLAFLVDVIGSSGLATSNADTTISVPNFVGTASDALTQLRSPSVLPNSPVTAVKLSGSGTGQRATITLPVERTDVVDIAVGAKFSLPGGMIGFVEAIVPLTSDGVRADVLPTGGISYTF